MADPDAPAWRSARRAVLDHLLGLLAEPAWSHGLVLRGSMCMVAWAPRGCREPADLDWMVPPLPGGGGTPYPFTDSLESVQQWPEAFDGAARYEPWREEEFGTAGTRPLLPPEGLNWAPAPEEPFDPGAELAAAIRRSPRAAPGIVLDPDRIRVDGQWTYQQYETPGIRLLVPWHADGRPPGEIGIDFARDERLPQAPVLTAVPRADGGRPTVLRTASRELSLAWKLLWLHSDWTTGGRSRGKDLYDAVLLAESPRTLLPDRLLRSVLRHALGADAGGWEPSAVRRWDVEWDTFRARYPRVRGTAEDWTGRLERALGPAPGRPSP
ncbi:nucleotidyl transferase AbiEii/AbiGii toxin family protein [Kitasatospora sp. NPDC088346]|uniref:nucleotidyl transferase AbiEii/AbiGii toxin family protein n=1 Tax=Kitasatospora sp. NPDC088346 TaxID=3364073 RepID=UPI0038153848